jgi:hypothetical protein
MRGVAQRRLHGAVQVVGGGLGDRADLPDQLPLRGGRHPAGAAAREVGARVGRGRAGQRADVERGEPVDELVTAHGRPPAFPP